MPSRTKNGLQELRCFCSRSPLLAVYGVDASGRPFVHIRVYKQNRVYCETLHRGGEVNIRCRECIRWHRIFIQEGRPPKLVQVDEPAELQFSVDRHAGESSGSTV